MCKSSSLYASTSVMSIVEPIFMGRMFALQLKRFLSMTRSQINTNWSIFIMLDTVCKQFFLENKGIQVMYKIGIG